MIWWEARIVLDPEEAEKLRPDLASMIDCLERRGTPMRDVGVLWDPEAHELRITSSERDDVAGPAGWIMRASETAQVHVERCCYRTLPQALPPSPWRGLCECPPGTHPGAARPGAGKVGYRVVVKTSDARNLMMDLGDVIADRGVVDVLCAEQEGRVAVWHTSPDVLAVLLGRVCDEDELMPALSGMVRAARGA